MITYEILQKIESLFRTMQILDGSSVQIYDPREEYRCYYLFAKDFNWKKDCASVHINFPLDKIRPWHLKQWEKRKKAIPAISFAEEIPGENIVRFGFKT